MEVLTDNLAEQVSEHLEDRALEMLAAKLTLMAERRRSLISTVRKTLATMPADTPRGTGALKWIRPGGCHG
jgi:predicted house-cleaning noncanonical NTP pyrophosphatase (MazG superfamily)